MKSRMTKRERVEATLQRQETDRVPVYDILVNDAVIEHFTGRRPPIGEEGLRLRLQATARSLDMTRMVGVAPQPPGDTVDADGFVHYRQDHWIGGGIRHRPFSDEEGANGTPDQVRQACSAAIDAAGPGYFIGSTTELDNGSRLENVLAMLEAAWNTPGR